LKPEVKKQPKTFVLRPALPRRFGQKASGEAEILFGKEGKNVPSLTQQAR